MASRSFRIASFVFVLCLACALSGAQDDAPTTAPLSSVGAPDIRALYVSVPGAATRSARHVLDMVERARQMHVTDIFVEAMVSGFAWYRSDDLPQFVPPQGEFVDVLQVLLNAAHSETEAPLRVHAVVAPTLALDRRFPYETPLLHATRLHPEWVCRDATGRTMDADGAMWLDPANPEVVRYCRSAVSELLKRYAVDGVCFAGLRYPATDLAWGYGDATVDLFRIEKDFPKDKMPMPEAADWVAWRAGRVTNLLTALHDTVRRSERPKVVVSATALATGVAPGGDDATQPDFQRALQYWPVWTRSGRVDWLVLEDYHAHRENDGAFLHWVDYARPHDGDARLVVGVSGARNSDSGVAMQMRLALSRGVEGLMLHSYDQPAMNVSPTSDILGYIGKTLYSPDYVLPSYFREAMYEQAPPTLRFPAVVGVDDLPQPVPIKPVKIAEPKGTVRPKRPVLSQKDAVLALLGKMDPKKRAALEAYEKSGGLDASGYKPLPPNPDLAFLNAPWVRVTLDHGVEFTARHLAGDGTTMRFRTQRRGVELNVPRHLVRRIQPIAEADQDKEQ